MSRGSIVHKTLDGKSLVQGNRKGISRSDSLSSAHYSDDVDRGPVAHRHAQRVRDAGVESTREAKCFVHEVLPHVHLLVLVKHCEVGEKHECLLSVHMHTHSRRRPWRRLPPPPSATAWAGRRHAKRLSTTRLSAYHPNRILSDTNNAHRNQNCAHLVCTSLLRLRCAP